ncbi:hypothetical protein [Chryseobacterium luteum]|uniref:Cell wall anchor protein n=1 Tax=Chryseobacterium luteum TaxID=421531 RepID=A0A085ZB65_9FLAO|nr:hypothetical protein [Chryseobacterium luteum]KFF01679.1 hypothetical protein IX38_16555 [Chryseobacterium luteum]
MKKLLTSVAFIGATMAMAQVGINTEMPKASLDVMAEPANPAKTDGLIAPRLTGTQLRDKDALYTNATGQTGTIIYATTASPDAGVSGKKTININRAGYYYFDGSIWQMMRIEPWNDVATNEPATLNNQNIYQMGNVGIGTNAPGRPLEIVRESTGAVNSGIMLTEYVGNQGQYGSQFNLRSSRGSKAGPQALQPGDVIASYLFDYYSSTGFTNGDGSKIMSNYVGNGTNRRNDLRFFTTASTAAAEKMRLDPDGNLGIGTGSNAITNRLQVVGADAMSGIAAASFKNGSGATGSVEIGASSNNVYFDFKTGNTLRSNVAFVIADNRLVINGNDSAANQVVVNTGDQKGYFGVAEVNPKASLHVIKAKAADLTPVIIEGLPSFGSEALGLSSALPPGGLFKVGNALYVKP